MTTKRKILSSIPLTIISAISIYTILIILTAEIEYEGDFYDKSFNINHYLGFGSLIICWSLFIVKNEIYPLVLSICLILGVFSLTYFTPDKYTWAFFITIFDDLKIGLSIQPLLLAILISNLYINSQIHEKVYNKYFKSDNKEIIDNNSNGNNVTLIESFKNQYSQKANNELEEVINNKTKYQNEAVLAATEILNKRNNKS